MSNDEYQTHESNGDNKNEVVREIPDVNWGKQRSNKRGE
jgi:hypothetical protein